MAVGPPRAAGSYGRVSVLRTSSVGGSEVKGVRRHGIHRTVRKAKREVLPLDPKRQQVVVMLAAGLSALPGHVDRDRSVPIRQIEDFPIARAYELVERIVPEC